MKVKLSVKVKLCVLLLCVYAMPVSGGTLNPTHSLAEYNTVNFLKRSKGE